MERYRLLDALGGSAKFLTIASLLLACCFAHGQMQAPEKVPQQLAVPTTTTVEPLGADARFDYAMGLVRAGRTDEARGSLLVGWTLFPADKRFPTELAGLAFKETKYLAAARWLSRASDIDPEDTYVRDFLGTVYFLLNNQEAALKHWNRVGKPYIETATKPDVRLDPVLLDRAIAYSQAEVLTLDELLATRARLRNLAIFPIQTFDLAARTDGKFDLALHVKERHGWGANKWEGLLTTFGGIVGQTVTPQYYNIHGTATNLVGSYRWDSEKRRAGLILSGPLRRSPKWRYVLAGGWRNENWDVRNFSSAPITSVGSLNLSREAVGAGVQVVESGKWSWATGVEVSRRDFRSITETFPSSVLLEGTQLKYLADLDFEALRIPERRFVVSTSVSTQTARIWSAENNTFFKLQAAVTSDWLPKAQGDDWQVLHRLSAGSIWGDVPFDELFILGLERDNDLPLRGHTATHRGRRGSAPMGTQYFLSNLELDKDVFKKGFVVVKLGPFVDTGKITGPETFGSDKWLVDVGGQLKVNVLGARITLSAGKDLRTGREAFYVKLGGWSTIRNK